MGERSGIAPIHSQLLKQHNNNTHFIGLPWPSSPSSAFYAHFARPHSTTRPNDMRTTFSSPQTGTSQQCRLGRAQWTRQHCCNQHALPLMLAHLDTAQWGASPPPRRFTLATINPLRRPPHPLQVHRGSSAPLLFMQAGSAKRLKSWHKRARARRS